MAEMPLQNVATFIEANGYVRISEPACGAVSIVLAAADTLHKTASTFNADARQRRRYQSSVFSYDVSQTTLRGTPALVKLGDTLRMTRTERAPGRVQPCPFTRSMGSCSPLRCLHSSLKRPEFRL